MGEIENEDGEIVLVETDDDGDVSYTWTPENCGDVNE